MNTASFERYWIPRIMILLHVVGVTGILAGYGQYFLDFTAVNLLVNGILALWADWEERHWTWIAAFGGGLAVEVIGVQTGYLFGLYSYGTALGPMVAGVPLILGVLWWISLTGCGWWADVLMGRLQLGTESFGRKLFRALTGATLMTAFDGLIEPVAIQAGWWAWEGVNVPWFNYASWWSISFIFYLLPRQRRENIGTGFLVGIFVFFFVFLNCFPWTH
ncbi:MAG: hypothetical protein CL845_04870 [Crocinitomicaceae bacterium]|nr:hypothetical protein [Crocinitomicaceae bacterium]